jgi:hypothetical protein
MDVIQELATQTWQPPAETAGFEDALEAGKVLYLPRLAFRLEGAEQRFLSEGWADGKAKNISLRGTESELRGARGAPEDLEGLRSFLARFRDSADSLVNALFPHYRGCLRRGFTSFRTVAVEGRAASWRKDDTRLHVDAFPSNPTGGTRLLRVFSNVNPAGKPRVWRVGEPFEDHARTFLPKAAKPLPGSAWLLETLGLTKSRRTEYDHYMGQLHDLGKANLNYQAASPQATFAFPAGSSWVVFSDQVLHAAMSGQYMLEQTFYLDPDHLRRPELGPLAVLERLAGRSLVSA